MTKELGHHFHFESFRLVVGLSVVARRWYSAPPTCLDTAPFSMWAVVAGSSGPGQLACEPCRAGTSLIEAVPLPAPTAATLGAGHGCPAGSPLAWLCARDHARYVPSSAARVALCQVIVLSLRPRL